MFPLGNGSVMAARSDPNDPDRDCAGEASAERPIGSTEELGAALRRSRKALGLTQAELALAAGVGLRFVGEVEAGKPSAQLGRVMQLIEALGGSLVLRSGPVPPEA
jgi:HTH-type transcriptional regulator/antitoxin HipB